ncbi:hypothetical protein MLDJOKPK_00190 [Salmonella phage SPAsTU]|nr:hypothetical protein MLDJOKPK_00190 [Salmonella phage SPAsTU]
MKVSSELVDMCRDPFVTWSLCMLRRDDRFSTFIREPAELAKHVTAEEERINDLKEMSNKFDAQLVVQSRLTSHKWRRDNALKGKTMPELIESLAAVVAKDNILWSTLHSTERAADDIRGLLTRCYFTFSK